MGFSEGFAAIADLPYVGRDILGDLYRMAYNCVSIIYLVLGNTQYP
jgi:hypothetical protein